MRQQFVIKNEKTRSLRLISHLLSIMNFLGLILLLIRNEGVIKENWQIVVILVIAFFSLFMIFIERFFGKPTADLWHRVVFALSATVWIKMEFWWIGAVLLFFMVMDYFSHKKLMVTITENHIILPGLINKKSGWNEIANMVLKDDILTVDFKSNRIFQEQIIPVNDDIDEHSFNEFCKNKLVTI